MPQEAWILKCYSCKKFQVQLKKKAKKWKCVVCGAKQDLMRIYFKGQPSDCRINVQNMNRAEGEMLEKFIQQSAFEEENYYYEDCENISQNSQSHNYSSLSSQKNSHDFSEDFTDENLAEIDEKCSQLEEIYSQESLESNEHCIENLEEFFQENDVAKESKTLTINEANNDEDVFDVNSIDFTIGEIDYSAPKVKSRSAQVLKLSIFESNSDFDESLDF